MKVGQQAPMLAILLAAIKGMEVLPALRGAL